jgi:hypothetical protein
VSETLGVEAVRCVEVLLGLVVLLLAVPGIAAAGVIESVVGIEPDGFIEDRRGR